MNLNSFRFGLFSVILGLSFQILVLLIYCQNHVLNVMGESSPLEIRLASICVLFGFKLKHQVDTCVEDVNANNTLNSKYQGVTNNVGCSFE